MYGFSTDMILSLLRKVLTFMAGIIVAKGFIGADMMNELVGAIMVLISVGLSVVFHASSNGVIPTLSTTPKVEGNIETRTVITPAKPATMTEDAKPVEATTTVSPIKAG